MVATASVPTTISSVKALAESSSLKSIPSQFTIATDPRGSLSDSLPVVDFSLLTSSDPNQRSTALHALDQACREWGFFILVNHGVPETVMKAIIDASAEFFELPEEEKRRYEAKSVSDPIKYGGGSLNNVLFQRAYYSWRDFIKAYVHPEFHCPEKPQILRDTLQKFSATTLLIYRKLMQAIEENLGFQKGFVDEILQLHKCYRLFVANYYPPCPEPDRTIGFSAHSDYGLLTFLIHNGVAGLQIEHNGVWFDTQSPHNSILVNTGDHLEILSNGRYKSVRHRAVVNTEATRISVVLANGAAPDAVVAPAPQLVEQDGRPFYRPMKFIEYVETLYSKGKKYLDCIKIQYEDQN